MAIPKREKKFLFLVTVTLIVIGASTLAIHWNSLVMFTSNYWFVQEIYRRLFKVTTDVAILKCANNYPDISFFINFGFLFLTVLGILLKMGDGPKGLRLITADTQIAATICLTYSSSLFYCLFVFFINFKFALLTMILFLWPMLLWKMEKINLVQMILGSILSAAFGYFFFKATVAMLLLLPTLHLIAIRTKNAISSRYVSKGKRIDTKLTATQKAKAKSSIKISHLKHIDWWDDVIEPELNELLGAFGTVISNPISLKQDESFDNDETSFESFSAHSSIKRSLVAVQEISQLRGELNNIRSMDPYFSQDQFLMRFEKIFMAVTLAHSKQDISKIQAMLSDSLYEQLSQKIKEEKNTGIRYECKEVSIYNSNIIRVQTKNDFQEIHVWVNANMTEVPIDLKTGEELTKDVSPSSVAEVYTFLRRPSAKTLQKPGLLECSCPNCGAPIKIGQVTVCEVCNGYIRSGNYDWVLSQITQACEWKYSNPDIIPAWNDLSKLDNNLCIQQIEEKASVVFWMLKNAEQNRKAESMVRFATPNFYQFLKNSMASFVKEYTNYENVSLASVKLQAIDIKNFVVDIYLLAVWSGIPVKYDANGRIPTIHRFCKPFRNVIVLSRKRGAVTKRDTTLTSAHCPNCGGPLTSNFDVKCSYCDTVLNDGSDWILSKVINEDNKEYVKLLAMRDELMNEMAQKVSNMPKNGNSLAPDSASAMDILTIAAKMMLADGIMDPSELEFLIKLSKRSNIPEERLAGIINSIKEGSCPDINFSKKTFKENKELLDIAVEMALADGVLDEKEDKTLKNFGHSMGYTDGEINSALRKACIKLSNK